MTASQKELASQAARSSADALPLRVTRHLYRTLPTEHTIDLALDQVQSAVRNLIFSERTDLMVLPVEDDYGLAAVLLVKERKSILTRGLEGYVYCLVPCRTNPPIGNSIATVLHNLAQSRDWTGLRLAVFGDDVIALDALLTGTNLNLGWIVTRKKLAPVAAVDDGPGQVRPATREDMSFVCESWRDAYLAGLQEEKEWQDLQVALKAADAELARVLSCEHSVLHVVESNDELVGFIAAEIGKPQELTGRRECHLYDYYVIPPYRGEGFSRIMTRCLERLALEEGCEYMTGTITGPTPVKMNSILTKIEQDGWVPYQQIYRCRAPLLQ